MRTQSIEIRRLRSSARVGRSLLRHLRRSPRDPQTRERPRGDGGITARVIWRQDGQWTAEKFAVGRNPLLAAKRFKTLVEEAGNRWPEGWVPGQGFVTVETPSDSGHEPTPLLAFGLRYVEHL